jgi:hypothetical protein
MSLFSSNKGVGDFLAASHWRKKADLMTAGRGEAERCGLQGAAAYEKSPTRQYGDDSKQTRQKVLQRVEAKMPAL